MEACCRLSPRNTVHHNTSQYGYHPYRAADEKPPRRSRLSREVALAMLERLANATGDAVNPAEDVIDLAQAVLALLEAE